jgi:hypothetical protein
MDPTITLNVGGKIFQTHRSTIMKYPHTMLAKFITSRMNKPNEKGEHFFDRNPTMFEAILEIYRTGKVYCPPSMTVEALNHELEFWGFENLALPVPPSQSISEVCRFDHLLLMCLNRDTKADYSGCAFILEKIIKAIDENRSSIVLINKYWDDWDVGTKYTKYFNFTRIDKVNFEIEEDPKDPKDPKDSAEPINPSKYFTQLNNNIYYLSWEHLPPVEPKILDNGTLVKPKSYGTAYICYF